MPFSPPARVLQVHNRYRVRGGEETVVEAIQDMLEAHPAVELATYYRDSGELQGPSGKWRAATEPLFERPARERARKVLAAEKPDLVHVHNVYPLITPWFLKECGAQSIPVVMTTHNYRNVCPIGTRFRDNRMCTDCAGGREVRCVIHDCRGNRLESMALALRHRSARVHGLFNRYVNLFLVLTGEQRTSLIETGVPAENIAELPNPRIADLNAHATPANGTYGLFVGRPERGKGFHVLTEACRLAPDVEVRVAGADRAALGEFEPLPSNLEPLGHLNRDELAGAYKAAAFFTLPHVWGEPNSMVVIEAMTAGLPVLTSNVGGPPTMVDAPHTGYLLEPGDPQGLAEAMRALMADAPLRQSMGRAARQWAEERFDPARYLERLLGFYAQVLGLEEGSPARTL